MNLRIFTIAFFLLFHSLTAQQAELNSEEYSSWRINYTPYKIKAIQAINDYRSLAKDSTLPRARFQDDLIVVQSRLSGNIEQVWYGNRGTRMNTLSRDKVKAVFSKSFIETIIDRNKYYYLNFDAFGDNSGQQKSIDYLYSTWWGNVPSNEISTSPARLSFYIPSSDLHVEFSVGDEYIGLPAWIGGFSRFGLIHSNFKLGIQAANSFRAPYGNQAALNGGLGGYAAMNLESFRIGVAGSFKQKGDFDNTVTDKKNIRYAGLQLYFSYSPLFWNEDWGAGRLWMGVTFVNIINVRENSSGGFERQIVPADERATPRDSLRPIAQGIASPLLRIEYVTPSNEKNYSTLELYVQFASLSYTTSIVFNLWKNLGVGVTGHANIVNDKLYAKGNYLFPAVRIRF